MFLLKAHWPEKFRDNYAVEHSGPGGGPVQVEQTVHVPDPETWAQILAIRKRRSVTSRRRIQGHEGNEHASDELLPASLKPRKDTWTRRSSAAGA